jgi:tRNA threonylcarbamoyladenosine biosynthesis protein TsaB
MQDAALDYDQLSAVAVIAGPGSYTSLRIGASTAKGLCYAHDIPLIAVDTLEHIVQPILRDLASASLAVAMLDARRMEVYTAGFTQDGERTTSNDPVIVQEDFPDRYDSHKIVLVGDGAAKTRDILADHSAVTYSEAHALAGDMAGLAEKAYRKSDFVDVAYWEPNYIKPVNIIKSKKKLL